MKKKNEVISDIRTFNRFYTDVIGLLNQHLLNSSYSLPEARILYELFNGKSMQASQITSVMQIDKSYLSRLLKKLEKEALIVKKQSEEDARAVQLSLTDKGLQEFEILNAASDKQISRLVEPLTEEQSEELAFHMKAIMDILNNK